jgi:ATP-binding cassette subfamily B protein
MLQAAGPYERQFRKMSRYSAAATVAQAASYVLFVPLLAELAREPVRPARAWLWVLGLAVLVCVEAVLRVREMAFTYDYGHLITEDTRLRLGVQLRTMPQQDLARRAAGDLTTVAGANVASAAMAVSTLSALFLRIVLVPLLLGVVVLVLDWRLGLVLVAATLAAVPLARLVQRRANAGFRLVDSADADVATRIVEYVQGLPVLQATGQAGASSPWLAAVLDRQRHAQSHANRSASVPVAGAQLVVQVALVGLVALGAGLVLGERLSLPLLVAIMVTAARFAEPLSLAFLLTKVFEGAEAALSRIGDVLSVRPLPVEPGGAAPQSFDIRFQGVTFTYSGHAEPALRDVDLVVPERSLTALVGPSGSGKTTITRLVSRYADPQAGAVLLGGVDLRTLPPDEVLRHIAVVFQDVYLFDDTIRANIAMARPDASSSDIEEAARAANIHDMIASLPDGYDTRAGEIGSALSGGERQRISIARAILKDAPIVLLDEPTAALDTESEVVVQRAIDELVTGKTVVVIAHRLSTIVAADQIVVLDSGRIVQTGTHADLLADEDGRYARMWAAQSRARDWHLPVH